MSAARTKDDVYARIYHEMADGDDLMPEVDRELRAMVYELQLLMAACDLELFIPQVSDLEKLAAPLRRALFSLDHHRQAVRDEFAKASQPAPSAH